MPPGTSLATRWHRIGTSALAVAGVWAAVGAYYLVEWPSLDAFVRFLDHCPLLFCDLQEVFYPQARLLLPDGTLAEGYFYSAPFALALTILRHVSIESATWLWAALEVATTIGVFVVALLPRRDARPRTTADVTLYALAFAISTPMLHNFKWGQVSALIVLLILLAVWLEDQERPAAAGALLGIAITIKYYPALFLALFVLRRNWRAVGWSLGTVALLALTTLAALGVEAALRFQTGASVALSEARWNLVPYEPNSQYFVHVFNRLTPGGLPGPDAVWTYAGYAFVAVMLVALWCLRDRGAAVARWAPVILLTTTPFWVPTSWPHYLIFLPAAQLAVLDDLRARRRGRAAVIGGVLLAVSTAASSSVLLLEWAQEWGTYSFSGYLLLADACVLMYALFAGIGIPSTRKATGDQ